MIQIKKIKMEVGYMIKGCFTCDEVAYWVIEGITHAFYCHPHLCILVNKIEKAVKE